MQVLYALLVVDTELLQHLRHGVFPLLQHGEEHVYSVDFFRFQPGALEKAQAENLLGLSQHGDLAVHRIADVAVKLSHNAFDARLHGLYVNLHLPEHFYCRRLLLAEDAEEQMFGTYRTILQAYSLVAAIGNSLLCVFC